MPGADDDDVVGPAQRSSSIRRSAPTQKVRAASQPIIGGASSTGMYFAPGNSTAGAVYVPRSTSRWMFAR